MLSTCSTKDTSETNEVKSKFHFLVLLANLPKLASNVVEGSLAVCFVGCHGNVLLIF